MCNSLQSQLVYHLCGHQTISTPIVNNKLMALTFFFAHGLEQIPSLDMLLHLLLRLQHNSLSSTIPLTQESHHARQYLQF